MNNKKSINIYMGIIGEAYVDKETAYAVLLAAKKNILDVQAIIEAANALNRPLDKAKISASKAITASVQVYNKLKDALSHFDESSVQFARLYSLLADLNENDFDNDFSNGGNIYTARENLTFAESLYQEIHDILKIANDLLDANKLNAVIRCKEYNIAKEIFESMIPEKIVSPEDLSDAMEAELLRRINEVRNNIDYINIVSDEIISISDEVSNKIDRIASGDDEKIQNKNERLYWYAGNINPFGNIDFMEGLGFTWNDDEQTYVFRKVTYEPDGINIVSVEDVDFGIDGPLRANQWFHHPLHLIQDGQLIAGVDGGKSKEKFWYVAVPRHILTAAGSTAYKQDQDPEKGTQEQWAAAHADDKTLVDSLYPCKPQDYEHIDDAHGHPIWNNEWMDQNANNMRDEDDENEFGYEKITEENSYLSINGIIYDVWQTPVTIYNKQRLNVYFNFGEPETQDSASGLYWYVGKVKPSYSSNPGSDEGWMQITEQPTAESPLTYENTLDSKIFYIAIPKGFGIFNEDGVELTATELEAESPYTLVYSTLIGKNSYEIYITGNEDSKFFDKVYAKENIIIEPEEPTGETEPIEPTGETEPEEPGGGPNGNTDTLADEDYLIYIGLNRPTEETDPNDEVASNFYPVVEGMQSMGWRSIGQDISIYNSSNPAYNGGLYTIGLNKQFNNATCYVVVPVGMGIYDGLGNQGGWTLDQENITIKGHQYNVYVTELEGEFGELIYGTGNIPVEPTGDTEPVEPTGDTEPVEPTGDTEPVEPTGDTEPVEPIDPNYYLYIGLTEPTNNSNPVDDLVQGADAGWRNLGESLDVYNAGNKAFNGGANTITLDPEYNDVTCYIAMPEQLHIYDGLGSELVAEAHSTITINGKSLVVYALTVEGEFGLSIY